VYNFRFHPYFSTDSAEAAHRIVASTPPADEDPVLPEEFLTFEFLQNAKSQQPKSGSSINLNAYPSTLDSRSNGSPAFIPKPFWKTYRLYLSLLGALLPFLGLSYFLIYFVLFEVGFVTYYGQIPVPPSTPNIIFTLVMVMGLKEQDVNKIKIAMRVGKWIFKDLCVFMISNIIPQLVVHLLYQGQII